MTRPRGEQSNSPLDGQDGAPIEDDDYPSFEELSRVLDSGDFDPVPGDASAELRAVVREVLLADERLAPSDIDAIAEGFEFTTSNEGAKATFVPFGLGNGIVWDGTRAQLEDLARDIGGLMLANLDDERDTLENWLLEREGLGLPSKRRSHS